MKLRTFRPGLDGDPERKEPRFRESGSSFEPAHRQLVTAIHAGRRLPARYDRDRRQFWLRWGPGDYQKIEPAPEQWEQAEPKAREGISADEFESSLPG